MFQSLPDSLLAFKLVKLLDALFMQVLVAGKLVPWNFRHAGLDSLLLPKNREAEQQLADHPLVRLIANGNGADIDGYKYICNAGNGS